MERILEYQRTEMARKRTQDGERNLLNKWFQDSVKNYIMEAHAAPLLKKRLKSLNSIKEVKNYIHNMISNKHKKYMGILNAYYEALGEVNCREAFCRRLIEIINDSSLHFQNSDQFNKIIRKQFVCILILYFFENKSKNPFSSLNEISSFFDLWNMCFPQERQSSKKKPKDNQQKESSVEFKGILLESSVAIIKNSPEELAKQSVETPNPVKVSVYEKMKLQVNDNEDDDNENLNFFSEQPPLLNNSQITCYTYLFKKREMNISFPDNEEAQTPTYQDCYLDREFIPESYNYFFNDIDQQAQIYEYTNTQNPQDNQSILGTYFGDSGFQSYPMININPQSSSESNFMMLSQRFCKQSLELTSL